MNEIERYLKENDYASIEEWALDSDYYYDKHTAGWFDEEGNPVDIEEKLWYALDSMLGDK